MKKMRMIRMATQGRAWKDLMKVQRRVLMPSPFESSLTSLMTRKRRKKETEIMSFPGCGGVEARSEVLKGNSVARRKYENCAKKGVRIVSQIKLL